MKLFIFLLVLFCISPLSFSFAFPNPNVKPNTVFIDTLEDIKRRSGSTFIKDSGIGTLGLPKGATLIIPDTGLNIGYVDIPMGKSSNRIFIAFSLDSKAPNNYAVAYALANGITGDQPGSLTSIERILGASATKDNTMKWPSEKSLTIKLYPDRIPSSTPTALGNFVMRDGWLDEINIIIREPADMLRTFVHEIGHFINRDIGDGNASLVLFETVTLLLEGRCFNNNDCRFLSSTDFYNSITSGGAIDLKKLTDVVSEALLANNDKVHTYQIAELLGKIMMEKLAKKMPGASTDQRLINQRFIKVMKEIIKIQRDFSRIAPTSVDGEVIPLEKAKALNTIAKQLGFSDFPDMVSSMNIYYEKNIYADAKKLAGFKYLMEELRLSALREEETQIEIPPPPLKRLTVAPQSQRPVLRPVSLPASSSPSPSPSSLSPIPQRDIPKLFPQWTRADPIPRMTRAQAKIAMDEWIAMVNKQKMSLSKISISKSKVSVLRGLGGTFLQLMGFLPLPSEIINEVVGATDQDWIDLRNDDIKNAEAKISNINDTIVNLEARRDAIPSVSFNLDKKPRGGVSMKGDNSRNRERQINALQQQIDVLYEQRDEWMDAIQSWQNQITEKIDNQIRKEYSEMSGKKYFDRGNQPVY